VFSNHHRDLGENFDIEKVLAELDNKIMDLGNFDWEIGPGTKQNNPSIKVIIVDYTLVF